MITRRHLVSGIASIGLLNGANVLGAGRPITLGQSVALTGSFGEVGTQFNLGAKLFFDSLNARGGIDGTKIDLRLLDDGDEPERCWNNTERFINDGVFALFGYGGSAPTLSILALASQGRLPLFGALSGAQALRQPYNPYVLNVRASYFDEASAIVKHFNSVGAKRVAVVYQDDSLSALEGINLSMDTIKLRPVANATVARNSTDVSNAVAGILKSGPEAIIQICSYRSAAEFIRQARRAGYAGNFYSMSFVGAHSLISDLGVNARGVMVSQVAPSPYTPAAPITAEFLTATKAKGLTDSAVNHAAMEGFLAAKAFATVYRSAGKNVDRESFVAAAQSTQNANIGGLELNYDAKRNSLSSFVEMTILTERGRILR